jgi:DNA (cytosine-5)-methyltransferase 1
MIDYYNEIDPYPAQWIRNLIAAGHLPPGDVDERSIEDVRPSDLGGYRNCHFFAGIGVWALALRNARWPDDRQIWTASCPCQPFSTAGKGAGFADARHLWPALHYLIEECRPAIVVGEQVASPNVNPWLDLVQTDLEGLDYGFAATAFPAASIGAPHIRDRTYWMANADDCGRHAGKRNVHTWKLDDVGCCEDGIVGDANGEVIRGRSRAGDSSQTEIGDWAQGDAVGAPSALCELADAFVQQRSDGEPRLGDQHDAGGRHESAATLARLCSDMWTGPTNGFWRAADWLLCRDGKWRPVEPGTFPLVDGTAGDMGRVRADKERQAALLPRKDQGSRVGRLRGYGNAIVEPQAREFILAVMDCLPS